MTITGGDKPESTKISLNQSVAMKTVKAVAALFLGVLCPVSLTAQNSDTPSLQLGPAIPAYNDPNGFGDAFGEQIDISGDTIIVGVPNKRPLPSEGLVYFFYRNVADDGLTTEAEGWGQLPPEESALPSDTTTVDGYGIRVAIDGYVAAVASARYTDIGGDTYGAVEVFERRATTGFSAWDRRSTIFDPDQDETSGFGVAIDICNDLVIVGAPRKDTTGDNNGVAYIFERNQGGENRYELVATLSDPLGGDDYYFGSAVSISNDLAVVSAPGSQGANGFSGVVLVFQRNRWDFGQPAAPSADNWGLEARIGSPNGYDEFGHDVALENDTLVVGQRFHSANGADSGAAFVYQRQKPGGILLWEKVADLFVPGFSGGEWLGDTVDISEDIIVAGAPKNNSIHLFHRNHGGPDQWGLAESRSSGNSDEFGQDVAIDGHTVVGGAPLYFEQTPDIFGGRMEIFNLEGKEWVPTVPAISQRHTVWIDERASLGEDVDIHGDTAIIGGRGVAYILRRNYDTLDPHTPEYEEWGMIKKLTAPAGSDPEEFGRRVAINQGYAAVADGADVNLFDRDYDPAIPMAVSEDAWGLRQQKNIAPFPDESVGDIALFKDMLLVGVPMRDDPGEAKIYYQNEGGPDNWGLIKTLTASNGTNGDDFGFAVDLGLDSAIIGAPERSNDGAAYVFERNHERFDDPAENWGEVAALDPEEETVKFGISVAIDGLLAAVGDSGFRAGPYELQPGKAHVFYQNQGGFRDWGKIADVTGPQAGETDHDLFGYSVDLRHGKLVVGSPGYDRFQLPDMGIMYVFQRNIGGADNWGLEWCVPDCAPVANGQFGAAVATNGVHALVGEPDDLIVDSTFDTPDYDSAGEVSIYRWDWTPYWDWADTQFAAGDLADPLMYETYWGPKADPDNDDVLNLWEEITMSNALATGDAWPRMPRSFADGGDYGLEVDHLELTNFPEDTRLKIGHTPALGAPTSWVQAGLLGRTAGWEVETGFTHSVGSASGGIQETRFSESTASSEGYFQITAERR